jgi:hypothetical protein
MRLETDLRWVPIRTNTMRGQSTFSDDTSGAVLPWWPYCLDVLYDSAQRGGHHYDETFRCGDRMRFAPENVARCATTARGRVSAFTEDVIHRVVAELGSGAMRLDRPNLTRSKM